MVSSASPIMEFTVPTFSEALLLVLLPLFSFSCSSFGASEADLFRVTNEKPLSACASLNPYLKIDYSPRSNFEDEEYVNVTVSGIVTPSEDDWVGMFSPAHSNVKACPFLIPKLQYEQTGDLTSLPLTCVYPVKSQYLSNDPDYLKCNKKECTKYVYGRCVERTCSGTLSFHVINIRTDIEFILFGGGYENPCVLLRSTAAIFANPNKPLYGHLSSVDSTATLMKLTWVSGDKNPQEVQYGNGKTAISAVTTFTKDEMCSTFMPLSPASNFGWHDPGYIHSAFMVGLEPSTTYSYVYGSYKIGWSGTLTFKTPPAGGADELKFIVFGDMGNTPRDLSDEHLMQPGAILVLDAIANDVSSGNVDSIFHIGGISYATGFLVKWDYFLHHITPVASKVSYMTAIGNHERDYTASGSVYKTTDSGGECGIPYETYFPMPTSGKDKSWYSIEQGSVHFTVISTEHNWAPHSEQYNWTKANLASVNRSRTPWLIFTGHRPFYSSVPGGLFSPNVDAAFVQALEPLLLEYKVDLVLVAHVHNYERTCAVYQEECKAMPVKDANGTDTYDSSNYTAPVHATIGMAGFTLDQFPDCAGNWSLVRIAEFGYVRVNATRTDLSVEYVNAKTKAVDDRFRITKPETEDVDDGFRITKQELQYVNANEHDFLVSKV